MLDPPKMEPKLKVLPVTVVASSPASTDEVTLLPQGAETSDAPVYNTQSDRGLRVVIVSLVPLRKTELHLASADETIGLLKSRFLDFVYSDNPSMREQQQRQQLDVRLFYDGIRLGFERPPCSLSDNLKIPWPSLGRVRRHVLQRRRTNVKQQLR